MMSHLFCVQKLNFISPSRTSYALHARFFTSHVFTTNQRRRSWPTLQIRSSVMMHHCIVPLPCSKIKPWDNPRCTISRVIVHAYPVKLYCIISLKAYFHLEEYNINHLCKKTNQNYANSEYHTNIEHTDVPSFKDSFIVYSDFSLFKFLDTLTLWTWWWSDEVTDLKHQGYGHEFQATSLLLHSI